MRSFEIRVGRFAADDQRIRRDPGDHAPAVDLGDLLRIGAVEEQGHGSVSYLSAAFPSGPSASGGDQPLSAAMIARATLSKREAKRSGRGDGPSRRGHSSHRFRAKTSAARRLARCAASMSLGASPIIQVLSGSRPACSMAASRSPGAGFLQSQARTSSGSPPGPPSGWWMHTSTEEIRDPAFAQLGDQGLVGRGHGGGGKLPLGRARLVRGDANRVARVRECTQPVDDARQQTDVTWMKRDADRAGLFVAHDVDERRISVDDHALAH